MLYNVPMNCPSLEKDTFHYYWRIKPFLHRLAGFELMSDVIVNPVAPEVSAPLLRDQVENIQYDLLNPRLEKHQVS